MAPIPPISGQAQTTAPKAAGATASPPTGTPAPQPPDAPPVDLSPAVQLPLSLAAPLGPRRGSKSAARAKVRAWLLAPDGKTAHGIARVLAGLPGISALPVNDDLRHRRESWQLLNQFAEVMLAVPPPAPLTQEQALLTALGAVTADKRAMPPGAATTDTPGPLLERALLLAMLERHDVGADRESNLAADLMRVRDLNLAALSATAARRVFGAIGAHQLGLDTRALAALQQQPERIEAVANWGIAQFRQWVTAAEQSRVLAHDQQLEFDAFIDSLFELGQRLKTGSIDEAVVLRGGDSALAAPQGLDVYSGLLGIGISSDELSVTNGGETERVEGLSLRGFDRKDITIQLDGFNNADVSAADVFVSRSDAGTDVTFGTVQLGGEADLAAGRGSLTLREDGAALRLKDGAELNWHGLRVRGSEASVDVRQGGVLQVIDGDVEGDGFRLTGSELTLDVRATDMQRASVLDMGLEIDGIAALTGDDARVTYLKHDDGTKTLEVQSGGLQGTVLGHRVRSGAERHFADRDLELKLHLDANDALTLVQLDGASTFDLGIGELQLGGAAEADIEGGEVSAIRVPAYAILTTGDVEVRLTENATGNGELEALFDNQRLTSVDLQRRRLVVAGPGDDEIGLVGRLNLGYDGDGNLRHLAYHPNDRINQFVLSGRDGFAHARGEVWLSPSGRIERATVTDAGTLFRHHIDDERHEFADLNGGNAGYARLPGVELLAAEVDDVLHVDKTDGHQERSVLGARVRAALTDEGRAVASATADEITLVDNEKNLVVRGATGEVDTTSGARVGFDSLKVALEELALNLRGPVPFDVRARTNADGTLRSIETAIPHRGKVDIAVGKEGERVRAGLTDGAFSLRPTADGVRLDTTGVKGSLRSDALEDMFGEHAHALKIKVESERANFRLTDKGLILDRMDHTRIRVELPGAHPLKFDVHKLRHMRPNFSHTAADTLLSGRLRLTPTTDGARFRGTLRTKFMGVKVKMSFRNVHVFDAEFELTPGQARVRLEDPSGRGHNELATWRFVNKGTGVETVALHSAYLFEQMAAALAQATNPSEFSPNEHVHLSSDGKVRVSTSTQTPGIFASLTALMPRAQIQEPLMLDADLQSSPLSATGAAVVELGATVGEPEGTLRETGSLYAGLLPGSGITLKAEQGRMHFRTPFGDIPLLGKRVHLPTTVAGGMHYQRHNGGEHLDVHLGMFVNPFALARNDMEEFLSEDVLGGANFRLWLRAANGVGIGVHGMFDVAGDGIHPKGKRYVPVRWHAGMVQLNGGWWF